MSLFGIASLMEYFANPDVMGPSSLLIKIYYVSAAPLVGLLGAGVLYLLVKRKIANIYLGVVIILSSILLIGGLSTDLNEMTIAKGFLEGLPEGFKEAVSLFPFSIARLPSILLNSTGGSLLIGGALFSFVKDRKRTYNIPLIIGGIFASLGGVLLGIIKSENVFFEFELAGVIFLFLGFILSMRYLGRK